MPAWFDGNHITKRFEPPHCPLRARSVSCKREPKNQLAHFNQMAHCVTLEAGSCSTVRVCGNYDRLTQKWTGACSEAAAGLRLNTPGERKQTGFATEPWVSSL